MYKTYKTKVHGKTIIFVLALVFVLSSLTACNNAKSAGGHSETNSPNPNEIVKWEGNLPISTGIVEENSIIIPGYKKITIKADEANVDVSLTNPEGNKCYFIIKIMLEDTGETLFTSELISPGMGLYKITLNRPLPAGKYPAKIIYEPYSIEDGVTPFNNAEINFSLIVE